MKRVVLPLITLGSFLLCIFMITLWARSYRPNATADGADSLDLTHHDPLLWFISNPGRLTFCRQVGKDWDSPHARFKFLGLEYASSNTKDPNSLCNLLIPYWMLTTFTLILPLTASTRYVRRKLKTRHWRPGLCPNCLYDLRATPDRCPECGSVPREVGTDGRV
jgi:hypothetical protein